MDAAARLLDLLRVASPTGSETAIADLVEARLRARLPDVRRHGNALAGFGPRRGRPLIALVGHLDTVPAAPGDANVPRIEAGRVHGLGASDMKGAIACDLALLEILDLDAAPFDLAWVLYDREEGPLAENGLMPLIEAAPAIRSVDLALCGEPTDNTVQLGCMGTLQARVTIRGRAAHSARPWHGENAIHAAAPLLAALAARTPRDVVVDGLVFREVMSATLAQGGHAKNIVPERFELNVNVRFAPGRDDASVDAEVRALVGDRAEVEIVDRAPAAAPARSHPLVARLLASTGAVVEPKQAWTDVAQLARLGIAAVNFGPGEQSQAHQRGESIGVEALERGLALRQAFLG